MTTSPTKLRLPVLLAGALALGTVAVQGCGLAGSPAQAAIAVSTGAPGLASSPGAAAPVPSATAPDARVQDPDVPPPAPVLALGSGRASGGAPQVDPRVLSIPLAERFTQSTSGASNPGTRPGPADTPMTGMLAAVMTQGDRVVRSSQNPPIVIPPPPGGEEEEECGEGEVCPGPMDPVDPVDPPPPTGVPEIDANLLGTGLLLMIGGALVLSARRREEDFLEA
ncbi:hypothetical protein Pla163_31640 [Planctomycetes bacterium Pla163]|uniref:Gram-positive cocci surface proteins LPxTG domain-containing protein n=1 Tax=Rohdeia mirabilis TaxID=2528008 RepID=A0A518D3G7_9BACT|nr:hypothetical protein Pla163_31640 [Planctomycetes bacterium Pla163]